MLSKLMNKVRNNESGATAIEYGLIAALIAIAAIAGLSAVSGALDDTFTKVETELDKAVTE